MKNYGRGHHMITILLTTFQIIVVYANCLVEHEQMKYSMNNITLGTACNKSKLPQGSEKITNLCDNLVGNTNAISFEDENVLPSSKLLCTVLETTKLFTKTPNVLIVALKKYEDTIHQYFGSCVEDIVPHKLWLLPERFTGSYIMKNTERWINNEVQKIIIFCSIHCTSLFFGFLKTLPGVSSPPVFFIINRKVLFLATNLPELVIAVEEREIKKLTQTQNLSR